MTGSVALDVVIGLIFIYLLYSLLATVVCEIIANYWGLRARNLLYSIERMLEDSPKQSEKKVIALLHQIKNSTIRLFDTPEGPASCVFYRLPVIKYLARNTFHSKPSYITRQTFSKALFEIFRIYGGANASSDLEKIRNVLNGSLEHKGVLKSIRDVIVKSTQGNETQAKESPDYGVIYDKILEIKKDQVGLPTDATQMKLYKKILKLLKKSNKGDLKEIVVHQIIDEMLVAFGLETRSHMRSWLKDFSKALFEIFGIYGGAKAVADLEKIRNVPDGSLEHKGVLKSIRDVIVKSIEANEGKSKQSDFYSKIYDNIAGIVKNPEVLMPTDAMQAKLYKKILRLVKKSDKKIQKKPKKGDKDVKKDVVYQIDEMLNLFGHETRSHMRSLLKDSNDDLLKFRLHLEQWFDDTQDRAAGWYKQQVQVLLLIIGLAFAGFFNANTFDMVHKLSIDKDARDKMIQLASDYLKDPNSIKPNTNGEPPKGSSQTYTNARLDSLEKVQAKLRKQIDDANSLIGAGWPDLPESLSLLPWTEQNLIKLVKDDLLDYSIIELDTLIRDSRVIKIDTLFEKGVTKQGDADTLIRKIRTDTVITSPRDNIRILVYPSGLTKAVLSCIDEAGYWGAERYKGFNAEMTTIKVETGFLGTVLYMATTFFSKAFWGFLLTAIAISLGAPFWFDLLNKLMQIRGSVTGTNPCT